MALSQKARRDLAVALASEGSGKELGDLINSLSGQAMTVTTSAAAGGSNVTEVTFTVKDVNGTTMAKPVTLMVFLSDAADGEGLTATSASGTVVAKSASGTDLATLTSKKALLVQTKDNGTYTLAITDTAKTAFYPCADLLNGTGVQVGTVLATGNYG